MLAALEGCTHSRGSFACKIVRGDMQLAAYEKGTLNRGGRNCRWDCSYKTGLGTIRIYGTLPIRFSAYL